MAANEETIRYMPGAVRGSEALDLDRLVYYGDRNAEPEYEFEPEPEEIPEEEERRELSHGANRAPERRFRMSPLNAVGILLVVFVAVLSLLANVRLTALSTQTVELSRQLEEIREENSVLRIRYENTFHLNEIEEYAVSTLGMTRLNESQITVLGNYGGDRAEILGTGEREAVSSVLQEAGGILPAIRGYFLR